MVAKLVFSGCKRYNLSQKDVMNGARQLEKRQVGFGIEEILLQLILKGSSLSH